MAIRWATRKNFWCPNSHICKNRIINSGKWGELSISVAVTWRLRGHSVSHWAGNSIDLQQAVETFQPLSGRALRTHHAVYDSRYTSRVVFFSGPQQVLEGAFTVIVTWPQAGASHWGLLNCSPAHTVPVHPPTGTFCLPQAVSPSVGTYNLFFLPRCTESIRIMYWGRFLLGFAFAFVKDVSRNPDFSQAKTLKKLPGRR